MYELSLTEHQIFQENLLNSSRFPVFPGIVDTLYTTEGTKEEIKRIIIIRLIKHQCVEGLQWCWRTVAVMRANSEQMSGRIEKSLA